MSTQDQILLLIDNNCNDLNIGNISKLINEKFDQNYVCLNDEVIEKSLIASYLPIKTPKDYLDLSKYFWSTVKQFPHVIFISQDSDLHKKTRIFALFYRIVTGKSITLFFDFGRNNDILLELYPFFLNIYDLSRMKLFEFPEITKIANFNEYLENIRSSLKNSVTEKTDLIRDYKIFIPIFNYILNGVKDWSIIFPSLDNFRSKHEIKRALKTLESNFSNTAEFKFYDAQYALYPSLGGKLQVSIPGPNQNTIHVFKSLAADYHFRNLMYKNVLVTTKQGECYFVLPFYEDEQSTRQTVRFLVMNLYKVFNNSLLVDFIIIYLYMRVYFLEDKVVKTKYENMARLFIKRHGEIADQKEFVTKNKSYLLEIKRYFSELEDFDDNDLYYLFMEFVESDLNFANKEVVEKLSVVYVQETEVLQIGENELKTFECVKLSQTDSIEVNESNWPKNLNFQCPNQLLQFNSSTPFFICTSSYEEFLLEISQISWIKTILKYTDKLVLKGGAILDFLCKRKPKDFDLMNIGMSNGEFLDFLIKFCREEQPERTEFIQSSVAMFRVSLKNGDKLEFILNLNMKRDQLLFESYLPDQICYILSENKLVANAFTLWGLNYGYCQLDMERHPKSTRLSSKLNKHGFNFYFDFENENQFLKERLERYIWSIYQSNEQPSYSESETQVTNECSTLKGNFYCDKKRIFQDIQSFMKHIEGLIGNEDEKKALFIDFNGGYILPSEKTDPTKLANGVDWSF